MNKYQKVIIELIKLIEDSKSTEEIKNIEPLVFLRDEINNHKIEKCFDKINEIIDFLNKNV